MRLVFAGTPEVAVPSLRALASAAGHEVVGVITRADAPLGRKRVLTPSPVATAAEALGLGGVTIKANRLDEVVTDRVAALEPDLGVIVAYGGLVRPALLAVPRCGWINLHFSALPRWRGAAPVQWSVIAGDAETASTVFQLQAGLDDGPIWSLERTPIGANETAGNLLGRLAVSGAGQLVAAVDVIAAGTARPVPQEGTPMAAPKLSLDDARLDPSRPLAEVYARLRGVTPEPGAFVLVDGQRLKVLDAAPAHDHPGVPAGRITGAGRHVVLGTATTPLELLTVQPAGKKPMPAADWWRGLPADTVLTVDLADPVSAAAPSSIPSPGASA